MRATIEKRVTEESRFVSGELRIAASISDDSPFTTHNSQFFEATILFSRPTRRRPDARVHHPCSAQRPLPSDRSREDHRPAGAGDRHRGRPLGLALPLRRVDQQAVLRRHSQPHRLPGRRGGGEEDALAARSGVRTFVPPAAIAGVLFQVLSGASVTADLDGSGAPSTARLASNARGVELEIADGRGTRTAAALLPLDPSRISSAVLATGSLGSAG